MPFLRRAENPFRMPQAVALSTEKIPDAPKQAEAVLHKIHELADLLPREDVLTLTAYAFENALEDGLKLADRLHLTSEELLDICANPSFAIKHDQIYGRVLNFAEAHKDDVKAHDLKRLERSKEALPNPSKKHAELTLKDPRSRVLYTELSDIYTGFLSQRQLKAAAPTPTGKSRGQIMAERHLAAVETMLEDSYYTKPVRDLVEDHIDSLPQKPKAYRKWQEFLAASNTISAADLKRLCKDLELDDKKTKQHLRHDKYFFLKGAHDVQQAATESELKQEINKQLEQQKLEVQLNPDTGLYEAKPIEEENKEEQELGYTIEVSPIHPSANVNIHSRQTPINGKLYFTQWNGPKRCETIDDQGQKLDAHLKQARDPININGEVNFLNTNSAGKTFLYNSVKKTGELIGEYDHVGSPILCGGTLYFAVEKNNKHFYLDEHGNKFGDKLNLTSVGYACEVNGELYFEASSNHKKFIINENGNIFGAEYDAAYRPTEINGILHFSAQKSGQTFITNTNGERFSKDGQFASSPIGLNDKLYFVAFQENNIDGKRYIIDADGKAYGKGYDNLSIVGTEGNSLYCLAQNTNEQAVKIRLEITPTEQQPSKAKELPMRPEWTINKVVRIKDRTYYQVLDRNQGGTFVVNEKGQRLGLDKDEWVYDVVEYKGKTCFLAEKNNQGYLRDEHKVLLNLPAKIVEHPAEIHGSLFFSAQKKSGKRIITNEHGVRTSKFITDSEKYAGVSKPVKINGSMYFQAEIGSKQFIADEYGKRFGTEFTAATDPLEINTKLYFTAWRNGKSFLANEDGERFGEQYDFVKNPAIINGKLYFEVTHNSKKFIANEDGEEFGKEYPSVQFPSEVNGKLAFIAYTADKKHVLVQPEAEPRKKREKTLEKYSETEKATVINSLVYFRAKKNGKWIIANENGDEFGGQYDDCDNPVGINGVLYFEVIDGLKRFVVNEKGEVFGKNFDNADAPRSLDNKLYFTAQAGNDFFLVDKDGYMIDHEPGKTKHDHIKINGTTYCTVEDAGDVYVEDSSGRKFGAQYDGSDNAVGINGIVYFRAITRANNKSFIANEKGERFGEEFDYVGKPASINNQLFYEVALNNKEFIVNAKGERFGEEYDSATDPVEVNGQLAFLAEKDGKQRIVYIDLSGGALTASEQEQIDLLNLVHNPDKTGIKQFFHELADQDKQAKAKVSTSQRVAAVLNQILENTPEVFAATIGARRDRAPNILADRLISKLFPEAYRKEHAKSSASGSGLFGFLERAAQSKSLDPSGYLNYDNFASMEGGGNEQMDDNRTVMEFREPVNELVVTGLFGKYDGKNWSKSEFPLRSNPPGTTKETTVTLPEVRKGQTINLPKTLDSSVIPERVRGISGDREVTLHAEETPLGEAVVSNLPKVDKVAYSLKIGSPEPMLDISEEEYQKYKRDFIRENGKDTQGGIAQLPAEAEAFLSSDKFQELSPKEKVIAIEAFVRSSSFYDFNNQEVNDYKRGKSIEEKILISQMRIDELKTKRPELAAELKDKLFAGVCADFAEINCAMLRRAGFLSGVTSGFSPQGDKAQVKHAHATAFIVWPDALNKNRAIISDGTPSSQDPRLAQITTPSLKERDEQATAEISKAVDAANQEIAEILKILDSKNEAQIRALDNGRLEQALNTITTYQVKQSHVKMLEEMFNLYWYGGLSRMENSTQTIELQKIMEDYLLQHREAAEASKTASKPAGSKLFDMVQNFVRRFEKDKTLKQQNPLDRLDHILNLAKNQLDPIEARALLIISKYLRGKKIV